ncbi:MAG: tetratricopeptide repeat protein [Acidobacteriota bacterium]
MTETAREKRNSDHLFAEQPDLARLLWALRRVEGFALYFARCNVPAYRAKLIEAIRANLSRPIAIVDISHLAEMDQQTRPSVDGYVEEKLTGVSEDAVVFITGLENLLPSRDEERMLATTQELNWRRGLFQKMRRPMVFWLPEYALTLMARNAPDLYDWYSGVYDLEIPEQMRADAARATIDTIRETEDSRWMSKVERDRWEDVLKELLAAAEAQHGTENLSELSAVEQADLLDRLGRLYLQRAEHTLARDCLTRALNISEEALGPDHPNIATRLNNLAYMLKDIGDLQNARILLERALKIAEEAFGPNHPNVASHLDNLALVLNHLGELQSARILSERALKIAEEALGPNHPNVATSLNNLALVLKDSGDPQKAINIIERSLKIDEAAFGQNHPKIANRLNSLACVLKDLGELQQARELFERSLSIIREFLGDENPQAKTVKRNLDVLLREIEKADSQETKSASV